MILPAPNLLCRCCNLVYQGAIKHPHAAQMTHSMGCLGQTFNKEIDMPVAALIGKSPYQEPVKEPWPDTPRAEVYQRFDRIKKHLREWSRSEAEYLKRVKILARELGI